jgi:dihydrofolate reductase
MKRVRYSVAMSLDGYIAGPNGEFDWIVIDPEIDFTAIFQQFDTILMGRRTYEVAGRQTGGGARGMKVYVFSRTLRQADCRGVIVSDNPAEILPALKAESGKDIWLFGGGDLFRSLLDLGMVDAVEVAIVPVLLGNGLRLVPHPAEHARLTLTGHRIYEKTGTVSVTYAVA